METDNLSFTERRAFWAKHIEQWRQSGQSQKHYCQQANLKPYQLSYWVNKGNNKPETNTKTNFVAINALTRAQPDYSADFTLVLTANVTLQWQGQADPAYIAQLAKGLTP